MEEDKPRFQGSGMAVALFVWFMMEATDARGFQVKHSFAAVSVMLPWTHSIQRHKSAHAVKKDNGSVVAEHLGFRSRLGVKTCAIVFAVGHGPSDRYVRVPPRHDLEWMKFPAPASCVFPSLVWLTGLPWLHVLNLSSCG